MRDHPVLLSSFQNFENCKLYKNNRVQQKGSTPLSFVHGKRKAKFLRQIPTNPGILDYVHNYLNENPEKLV
jgi:hypothetical protein